MPLFDNNEPLDEEDDEGVALLEGSEDLSDTALLSASEGGNQEPDQVMINAIKVAMTDLKREWKIPSKVEAAFAVLSGFGAMAAAVTEGILPERQNLKCLVPPSKKRWGTFVTATMAAGYIELIPGLNMIAGPIAAAVAAKAKMKDKQGVLRAALTQLGAGAIDSTLEVVSAGAYSLVLLATAWFTSAGAIWTLAEYYKESYGESARLFTEREKFLRDVYDRNQGKKLSFGVNRKVNKCLEWLNRQNKKCLERGKLYEALAQEAEAKCLKGIDAIKRKLQGEKDPMKQKLLADDYQSSSSNSVI